MAGFNLPLVNPALGQPPDPGTMPHMAVPSAGAPPISAPVPPVAAAPLAVPTSTSLGAPQPVISNQSQNSAIQPQNHSIQAVLKQLLPVLISGIVAKRGGAMVGNAVLNGYAQGIAKKHQDALEQQQMQAKLDASNLEAQQQVAKLEQDRKYKLAEFVRELTTGDKSLLQIDDPAVFAKAVDAAEQTAQIAYGAPPGLIKGQIQFNDSKRLEKDKKDAQTLLDNFVKLHGAENLDAAIASGAMIGGKRIADLAALTQYNVTDAQGKPFSMTPPDTVMPVSDEKTVAAQAVAEAKKAARMAGKPFTQTDATRVSQQAIKAFKEATRLSPQAGDNGLGPSIGSPEKGLTGEAFLATVPVAQRGQIKALAEGRQAFPTGISYAKLQSLIQAVNAYDPTFDATNYQARYKTRADLSSTNGTGGKTINALNTAIQHAGKLSDLIEALGNGDTPAANWIANLWSKATGKTGVTNYEAVMPQMMKEIERLWRGSGGSTEDINALKASMGPNMGIHQQREALASFVDLMRGKLDSTVSQRDAILGPYGPQIPVLYDQAGPNLEKIYNRAGQFVVVAPDHTIHNFDSQAQADTFRQLIAGVKK